MWDLRSEAPSCVGNNNIALTPFKGNMKNALLARIYLRILIKSWEMA